MLHNLPEWFEELYELARTDAEMFEIRRQELIDAEIERLGNKKQLRQLQWRIDMERRRCKTPLQSAIKIYDMMIDMFENKFRPTLYALACELEKLSDKSKHLKVIK